MFRMLYAQLHDLATKGFQLQYTSRRTNLIEQIKITIIPYGILADQKAQEKV